MPMGDRRRAKLIALAQTKVPEPVLAAALVLPKGKSGAMMLGGLAGMAVNSAIHSGEGFAGTNLFAVTEGALYAFKAANNFGVKVKEQIGMWPWGAFGASTKVGAMTQFLFLGWSDGSISELEVQRKGVQSFQGAVVDEIVGRAAAAGAHPPPVP